MRIFNRSLADEGVSKLRDMLHQVRGNEILDDLPERFTNVIDLYNQGNVDSRFRHDIHQILSGSVNVALSMVTPTFPVEFAITTISEQLAILSRILSYLQTRSSATGFSIFLPEDGQLIGAYTTEAEANQHLQIMRNLGLVHQAEVVPVSVVSSVAVRPRVSRLEAIIDEGSKLGMNTQARTEVNEPHIDDDVITIPSNIRPDPEVLLNAPPDVTTQAPAPATPAEPQPLVEKSK